MKLPESFVQYFLTLLGDEEAEAFFDSFLASRTYGLRVNTLKIPVERFLDRTNFVLHPVGWTRDGFRHDGTQAPGRLPDYHAGLYYSQDPSAMLPAELLHPVPGERVLDLCAAPGGKSVQLAAMMKNQGFLCANDISPKRVKALRRNLEGLGIACAVVANEAPDHLERVFPQFFDAILLDAPCSGEGMFRKDETAVRSWKRHDAAGLEGTQRELLESAWKMLRPGGRLVYSTCTYNPEENERNIAWALECHADMQVGPAAEYPEGLAPGRADWAPGHPELTGAVRVWPHLAMGEGQFAACLRKREDSPLTMPGNSGVEEGTVTVRKTFSQSFRHPQAPMEAVEAIRLFFQTEMNPDACIIGSKRTLVHIAAQAGAFLLSGAAVYFAAYAEICPLAHMENIRLEMPGLYVGDWEYGRFEPSSALLHALDADAACRRLDFPADSEAVQRYLHGETLIMDGERGWTALLVDGYPLGWAKQEEGRLKNRYPKGWRMQ